MYFSLPNYKIFVMSFHFFCYFLFASLNILLIAPLALELFLDFKILNEHFRNAVIAMLNPISVVIIQIVLFLFHGLT